MRKDASEDVASEDSLQPKPSSKLAASTTPSTGPKRSSGEYHTDEAVARLDYDSETVNFKRGESVMVMRVNANVVIVMW